MHEFCSLRLQLSSPLLSLIRRGQTFGVANIREHLANRNARPTAGGDGSSRDVRHLVPKRAPLARRRGSGLGIGTAPASVIPRLHPRVS